MPETAEKVWTPAELAHAAQVPGVPGTPRIRSEGDSVLIHAVARRVSGDAGWVMVSPCCGKYTAAPAWSIDADPDIAGFECGKPWFHQRGNSRRGGCRAYYRVAVHQRDDDGSSAVFRLSWTGRYR